MPEPVIATPPAGGEVTPPTPPTPPAGGEAPGGADPVAMAKRLGELEKMEKDFTDYKAKVDPVLETLWSDTELLSKATEVHERRLGRKPATPPAGDTPTPPVTPTPPAGDSDVRNSQINMISSDFEDKTGISKLDDTKKAEARGLVGTMLKEMLDPKGNKTIAQVFEEVSLTKLPWYLEQAWKIVNRDNDMTAAREAGKTEIRSQYEEEAGVIGSMPGGSVPIDQVTLTNTEKQAAAKMGVSEDKYLASKKAILSAKS